MEQQIVPEDYRDTLSELFNIGMGKAASSLSDMLNDEIILTVPHLDSMTYDNAMRLFGANKELDIDAVEQKFYGDFSGSAFLFFRGKSSQELVKRILDIDVNNQSADTSELSALEQETLVEVGNIILSACFGCIADVLDCQLESEVPILACGNIHDVLSIERMKFGETPVVLSLSMTFSLPNKLIQGQISLLMTTASVNSLIKELERYIQLYV